MATQSAGIVLYRRMPELQVYLGHMGGPFWEHKDEGAWGIPKGLVDPGESLVQGAIRECQEEVGITVNSDELQPLEFVKMKSGKEIHAWAYEVPSTIEIAFKSNTFDLEWPKGSGLFQAFPEVDRAEWFNMDLATRKIVSIQALLLERLSKIL